MTKLSITMHPDQKSDNIPIPLIAPERREDGSCVFHNDRGLCDIHELKPTEGRMAIHNLADGGLRRAIMYTWITPLGVNVMAHFDKEGMVVRVMKEMLPYVKRKI